MPRRAWTGVHHPKDLNPVVPSAAKIPIAPRATPSPSLSTSGRDGEVLHLPVRAQDGDVSCQILYLRRLHRLPEPSPVTTTQHPFGALEPLSCVVAASRASSAERSKLDNQGTMQVAGADALDQVLDGEVVHVGEVSAETTMLPWRRACRLRRVRPAELPVQLRGWRTHVMATEVAQLVARGGWPICPLRLAPSCGGARRPKGTRWPPARPWPVL